MSDPRGEPLLQFFGWAVMAFGILIALLAGLCAGAFLVMSMVPGNGGVGLAVLVVGGPPIAMGVGIFFLGRWMVKKGRPQPPKPDIF